MVKQNLVLCLLFATLDGICDVIARVVLIHQDQKREQGKPVSSCARYMGILWNLFFQGLSTLFSFLAPWFGPVSLFGPTSLCSELLANMIIVGFIMKHEELNKDTQVATYVMLLAVLILPTVGPGTQDDQTDPLSLLTTPLSLAWVVLFVILFIGSSVLMTLGFYKKMGQFNGELCLLVINMGAEVLGPTVARAFGNMESGGAVGIALIVFYAIIQIIWAYQAIIEAEFVASHVKYVPLSTCGALIFNALTGLIIWEDWRVIISWLGYVSTFLLMILGVYLMSDLRFFEVAEKQKNDAVVEVAESFMQTIKNTNPQDIPKMVARKGRNLSILASNASFGITKRSSATVRKGSRRSTLPPSWRGMSQVYTEESDNNQMFDSIVIQCPSSTESWETGKGTKSNKTVYEKTTDNDAFIDNKSDTNCSTHEEGAADDGA